ncbi:hypothetical protein J1TS5_10420 [Paenibacillus macerans]|uniref:AlbA family DNA-binding domain-containing protein n=1 Tax=Paenibacillus macerans TaxID=44252 RepID=UPI001AFFD4AC|nr:ATP-binding protein [Paenibacillus macerans]GIP08872.1 hypothetical protein J1TS5_10420 [Paenibacillus macerans]
MSLFFKAIDQITETDIEQLVNDEVPESRVLDYKEQLPSNSGDDKRELLYDITAFANSGGGELIYGVSEVRISNQPSGKPEKIIGVSIDNPDSLIRQWEELIRSNVQPRIFGIQMRAIPLATGEYVLVVRIPNSLNFPHMVSMGGTQRFYTRNSAGKHPMDITEIRSSILSSAEVADRIRDLRLARISKLKNNEGFTRLKFCDHMVVLHIVPFGALGPNNQNLDIASFDRHTINLKPMSTSGWNPKYNFDGFLTYSNYPNEPLAYTYVEITKRGIIEAVESGGMLRDNQLPIQSIAVQLQESVNSYLKALSTLGVRPPVAIMISLLGVRDFSFILGFNPFGTEASVIEQQDLLLPEIVIENYPHGKDYRILKPALDSLWNAAGFASCQLYNANGNWLER